MKPDHLNFCRQLTKQLLSIVSIPSISNETRTKAVHFIDLAHVSQKFMLPPGGLLIDDSELKALDGDGLLRLPSRFIALEYQPINKVGKFITFIREHTESNSFAVTPLFFANENGHWVSFATCFLPMSPALSIEARTGKIAKINFAYPETAEDAGSPEMYLQVASIVLGFLNALACSNVHIERSEATQSRKKAAAALPFDSYHILTIDTGKTGDSTTVAGCGSHRSPREHLRRGHIVRPGEGRKPFWRNATVVCAGRGFNKVEKDYRVKNSKLSSTAGVCA